MELPPQFIEIGPQCVWLSSSNKLGHEVAFLQDQSIDTFWQYFTIPFHIRSDGTLPHQITIILPELLAFFPAKRLEIYADMSADESYTPFELSIRAGLLRHEQQELHLIELDNPNGEMIIPLEDDSEGPIIAHVLSIQINSNYMEGKDSRIRRVRVIGLPVRYQSAVIFSLVY
ncbi:hypothetical protein DI09_49p190 [Mitosporidium daphniae]|uniref:DOC domain-containing protein n=1 Tax=Mitosporidium daphniae TaxID=1485682 RepID=A0A098VQB2_9MICR|nr:uncharacterized protein DI09_49p190 [Mitosporidium daphniae]KGG50989.1 hypothetical protein DI09_49p190 [Mitosporidium daphniae]|eukprot:XP_013237416.1 uncharacterized protein DI09_49p190 [Mitosporidium daphniae]